MDYINLLLIAIGLSMDAFAVSICNGLCYKNMKKEEPFIIALTFGVFQGIMPIVGFFLGSLFSKLVAAFAPWIAFILLSIIGGNMIFGAIKERKHTENTVEKLFTYKEIFVQGIATSIDALAVGVSFAILGSNIWIASSVICITTFIFCIAGVFIGKKFGSIFKGKAEIIGGLILIGIGIKILLENLL